MGLIMRRKKIIKKNIQARCIGAQLKYAVFGKQSIGFSEKLLVLVKILCLERKSIHFHKNLVT